MVYVSKMVNKFIRIRTFYIAALRMISILLENKTLYLSHTKKTKIRFPNIETSVSISSHKDISCYKHPHRVINARDSRCPAIMINEDHNCSRMSINDDNNPDYNGPSAYFASNPSIHQFDLDSEIPCPYPRV